MSSQKSFQKFLVDNGLIFEINRKVLHPLGLAIVVDVDRSNKRKLAITGLAETEDEEGFLYDEETFTIGSEKYHRFLDQGGQERLDARKAKYGFIEQDKADV
jgi:hypothetical protein